MIRAFCPACGKMIRSPDNKAGMVEKCPCGERIRLPEPVKPAPLIVAEDTIPQTAEAILSASKRWRIGWITSLAFGSLLVLALTATIVHYFRVINEPETVKSKPEIANSTLDYHAGIVNKYIYQMDDLLREMDKELHTSFSSQLDPELRLRLDRDRLDRAASATSMVRYSLKFNRLEKEMDKEIKELKELIQQHRPNSRLTGLLTDLQKARDKTEGIINALTSKIHDT